MHICCLYKHTQQHHCNSNIVLQEVEKRKKYEEAYKAVMAERKPHVVGGPDYEVSVCRMVVSFLLAV